MLTLMKTRFIIAPLAFVLTIFMLNKTNAQSDTFIKIFEKETSGNTSNESVKFKNIKQFSFYPDTLPSWFFNLPEGNQNCFYTVGISDPDMEPNKAKEMAMHRAKAIACLFNGSKLQYYRDVYTSEKESGKYTDFRQRFDTYFKVSSLNKVNNYDFALIDSHLTRYNEALVLVKCNIIPLDERNESQSVVGTVIYIENQVENAYEVQAEYELRSSFLQPEKSIISAHSLYREKGNKFLAYSQFLDSIHEFPVYLYKYASPKWDKNSQPLVCYNGLWSKFTREMLRFLTLETEQAKVKVKNLGEKHNPALTNLTRQIVSYKAQFKLNGIDFANDTFKLNLVVNEIDSEIKN